MCIFLVQDTGQNARFTGQCKSFMTSTQMAILWRVPHTSWWKQKEKQSCYLYKCESNVPWGHGFDSHPGGQDVGRSILLEPSGDWLN